MSMIHGLGFFFFGFCFLFCFVLFVLFFVCLFVFVFDLFINNLCNCKRYPYLNICFCCKALWLVTQKRNCIAHSVVRIDECCSWRYWALRVQDHGILKLYILCKKTSNFPKLPFLIYCHSLFPQAEGDTYAIQESNVGHAANMSSKINLFFEI